MQRRDALTETDVVPEIAHWINGTALSERAGEGVGLVYNPAHGKPIRRVAFAGPAIAQRAVSAAAEAYPRWAATAAPQRARVLLRYRDLLEQRREVLAKLITEENGKTLAEARAEVDRGIQVVDFATGIPHLMKGEHLSGVATELDSHSLRESLGVCVGITPFNFPAMVPLWMFPVAIAAGNTFILKASEKDPSTAVVLARLFEEAGLPPGVFNVVHGTKATVEFLINAAETAAVSFVGSSPVAHAVYRAASDAGKRAQCLGGAKNHMVLMPDADLDAACAALTGAAYGCAGERCMAISVAVAVGSVGDQLIAKLAERLPNLRVGPGDDPSTDIGPLVTAEHLERVRHYVDLGVKEGAQLIADGRGPASLPTQGFFLGPCLFDHVTPGMQIYRDEIFGPVLCVVRCKDLPEAISMINGHEYANGAAIFTRSGAAARRFTNAIQAGMVGVNVPVPAPTAYFGFGGYKRSLFGPLHIHGTDGVRFYTRLKTVTTRWPEGPETGEAPSGF